MNRAELRAEVVLHGVASGVYTGRINSLLNEAMRRVARKIQFFDGESEQVLTIVAGQSTYTLPADLGKLRYVRDRVNGGTLVRVSPRDIDEMQPSTGTPSVYAVTRAAITLYPTPSATPDLSVRYYALPTLMTADADVPGIPEDYHRLLPFYALRRCMESEDDFEAAGYWGAQWADGLKEMAVDVRFPSSDGPRQARSMWEV